MKHFLKQKKTSKLLGWLLAGLFAVIAIPWVVSAHEVYVLSSSQINQALAMPSFNLWTEIVSHLSQFGFWAFIGILLVFGIFWISTMRFLERRLDPFFLKIRPYATFIARLTIGLSFLAAAFYQAIYGPELPLVANFGPYAGPITLLLVLIGLAISLGFYVRLAALVALLMYTALAYEHGLYMLTYVNYLGEIIVLLILGAHNFSLDRLFSRAKMSSSNQITFFAWTKRLGAYLKPRSFAILRVLFGTALIYASVYAKILHNGLALLTVEQYHLDKLLGFEPHFLIMGGAIVEILIGLFFILGIEIRFTSLFLLFWLSLSLWFFGEVVWPHLILIGIPIAYVFYGYDDYSVEGYFFRNKKYEPVL